VGRYVIDSNPALVIHPTYISKKAHVCRFK
jgi:hypothetical protein